MRKFGIVAAVLVALGQSVWLQFGEVVVPVGFSAEPGWAWLLFGLFTGMAIWPAKPETIERWKAVFTYYNSGKMPEEKSHEETRGVHEMV